jgi:hypothetical protein
VEGVAAVDQAAIGPRFVARDPFVERRVAGDIGGRRQAVLGDARPERRLERREALRVDGLEAGGALPVEGGAALLRARQASAAGGVVTIEK